MRAKAVETPEPGARADGSQAPGRQAPSGELLARDFFDRPTVVVAQGLLGMLLLRRDVSGVTTGGIIVETEAYGGPEDRASHARAGRTRRTAPMFGSPGYAYVYLIYGLHSCLNVVTEKEGAAGAVLLRAILPTVGSEAIRARRNRPGELTARLAAGPARLCQALGVDRTWDGHDLTAGKELWLARPSSEELTATLAGGVVSGPRIGVAYAGEGWAERRWRFGLRSHPALSRAFRASS